MLVNMPEKAPAAASRHPSPWGGTDATEEVGRNWFLDSQTDVMFGVDSRNVERKRGEFGVWWRYGGTDALGT